MTSASSRGKRPRPAVSLSQSGTSSERTSARRKAGLAVIFSRINWYGVAFSREITVLDPKFKFLEISNIKKNHTIGLSALLSCHFLTYLEAP